MALAFLEAHPGDCRGFGAGSLRPVLRLPYEASYAVHTVTLSKEQLLQLRNVVGGPAPVFDTVRGRLGIRGSRLNGVFRAWPGVKVRVRRQGAPRLMPAAVSPGTRL